MPPPPSPPPFDVCSKDNMVVGCKCASKSFYNNEPDNPSSKSPLCCNEATKKTVTGAQMMSSIMCVNYSPPPRPPPPMPPPPSPPPFDVCSKKDNMVAGCKCGKSGGGSDKADNPTQKQGCCNRGSRTFVAASLQCTSWAWCKSDTLLKSPCINGKTLKAAAASGTGTGASRRRGLLSQSQFLDGARGSQSAPRHPGAVLGHVSGHLWGRHPPSPSAESAGESALTHVRCARGSRLRGAPAVEGAPCGHTPGAHEHVVCPAGHACIAAAAGTVAVDLDLRRFFKPVARHVCVTEARAAAIAGVERSVFPFPAVKDSDLARVVADVCEGPSALGRTVEVAVVPAARYHHAGQPRLGSDGSEATSYEAVSYEYTVSLCGPRRGGAVCWHDDMVCFAHTGTCGFPTEVDVSDKTILARYSNNWGNLSDATLQDEYGARRDELRDAAPDDPRLSDIADVPNRDFPMAC